MSTLELKGYLLDLIAEVNEEKVLQRIKNVVVEIVSKEETDIKSLLSEDQIKDLEVSIDEVEREENLVSHKEVFRKYEKWLKK